MAKPSTQWYNIATMSPYPKGTVLMAVGSDNDAQPLMNDFFGPGRR